MTKERTKRSIREFRRYVLAVGNQSEAGRRLGIDRGHVSRIINGKQRISPDLAERIQKDAPIAISRCLLVWGEVC